jgi:hypothetical protein
VCPGHRAPGCGAGRCEALAVEHLPVLLQPMKRELERAMQERHVLAEKLDQMRVFVDEISARLVTVEALDQCDQARLLRLFPFLAGGRVNRSEIG